MDGPFASTRNKWEEFERLISIVDKNGAFLVINYYNNNFDRLDHPSFEDDYIQMIELLKREKASFMTMAEAYNLEISKIKENGLL